MSGAQRSIDPHLMSEEEFLALPETAERVELVDGAVVRSPPPTLRHQQVVLALALFLRARFRESKAGRVVIAPRNLKLGAGRIVQPDLAVWTTPVGDTRGPLQALPNLVIEVQSEDHADDRATKRRLYAEAGVEDHWIVDPDDYGVEESKSCLSLDLDEALNEYYNSDDGVSTWLQMPDSERLMVYFWICEKNAPPELIVEQEQSPGDLDSQRPSFLPYLYVFAGLYWKLKNWLRRHPTTVELPPPVELRLGPERVLRLDLAEWSRWFDPDRRWERRVPHSEIPNPTLEVPEVREKVVSKTLRQRFADAGIPERWYLDLAASLVELFRGEKLSENAIFTDHLVNEVVSELERDLRELFEP